jgi:hypothetical protein
LKNQPNFDRKTQIFRFVEKKLAALFEFLTAPLSATAQSLKTTELNKKIIVNRKSHLMFER